mmetsp:Transcript_45219/g.88786  ORF Transcript_45219/g.88786 Transcript_45219/m.88786 type:complete len:287 (-) Transcript_45219:854-1714(-)
MLLLMAASALASSSVFSASAASRSRTLTVSFCSCFFSSDTSRLRFLLSIFCSSLNSVAAFCISASCLPSSCASALIFSSLADRAAARACSCCTSTTFASRLSVTCFKLSFVSRICISFCFACSAHSPWAVTNLSSISCLNCCEASLTSCSCCSLSCLSDSNCKPTSTTCFLSFSNSSSWSDSMLRVSACAFSSKYSISFCSSTASAVSLCLACSAPSCSVSVRILVSSILEARPFSASLLSFLIVASFSFSCLFSGAIAATWSLSSKISFSFALSSCTTLSISSCA